MAISLCVVTVGSAVSFRREEPADRRAHTTFRRTGLTRAGCAIQNLSISDMPDSVKKLLCSETRKHDDQCTSESVSSF